MSNDRPVRAAALIAIVLLLSLFGGSNPCLVSLEERVVFFAMDTRVSMTAYGLSAKAALDAARVRLLELERMWSVTDSDSDIFAVNNSGGKPVTVSEETALIIAFALDTARKTGGSFEPTIYPVLTAWGFTTGSYRIPADDELDLLLQYVGYEKPVLNGTSVTVPLGTQLDLGAVGKGYAADSAAALMRELGVYSAIIDLGGNVLTVGAKPDGNLWKIGIRNPFGEGIVGVVETAERSVVTSGGYERFFTDLDGETYSHIIDPSDGRPAQSGLNSATVIGENSAACDALSTAIYVMGLAAAEALWREYGDFEMILVTDGGEIYISEGLESCFTLAENFSSTMLTVIRP